MQIATDMQQENARLQNCASGSTSEYSSTPFQREVNISEDGPVRGLRDGSHPAGSRGGAPVGCLGTTSPRSWAFLHT